MSRADHVNLCFLLSLPRVFSNTTPVLQAMLHVVAKVEGSYIHRLRNATRWLMNLCPDMCFSGDHSKIEDWVKFSSTSSFRWNSLLLRARNRAPFMAEATSAWKRWLSARSDMVVHHELSVSAIDGNISFCKRSKASGLSSLIGYSCPVCRKILPSAIGWHSHMHAMHTTVDSAIRLARSSVCHSCNRDFHTRTRLVRHWRRGSVSCCLEMLQRFHPLSGGSWMLLLMF